LYAPEERLVTDRIDTFTERGIGLESGRELEADITVTATGLNLLAFGGITLTVNGEPRTCPIRWRSRAIVKLSNQTRI
jgi:cation diffusion facilitator CzcD-associated flavoprotein CzcO